MNNSKINLTACVSFLSKVEFKKNYIKGLTGDDMYEKADNGMRAIKYIEVTRNPKARVQTFATRRVKNYHTGVVSFERTGTTQRMDVNNLVGEYYPTGDYANELAQNYFLYRGEDGEIMRSNARVKTVIEHGKAVPMKYRLKIADGNPHGLIPCYKDFYVREDGFITLGQNDIGLNNAIVVTDENGDVIPKLYKGQPIFNIYVSNHMKENSKYMRLAKNAIDPVDEDRIDMAILQHNETAKDYERIQLDHPMEDQIFKFYQNMSSMIDADEFSRRLLDLKVAQLKALWLHDDLPVSKSVALRNSKLTTKDKLVGAFLTAFDNDIINKDSFRINASILENL